MSNSTSNVKNRDMLLASIIAVGIVSSGMTFYTISSTSDPSGIRNISKTEMENWRYFVQFEFCTNAQNLFTLGVWTTTDLEKIPIPINQDTIISECQKLAVKIRSDDMSSLTMSPFASENLPQLIKEIEDLRHNTNDKLVKAEQYLLKLQKQQPSIDDIENAKDRVKMFKEILQSTNESLKTLRAIS